LAGSAEKVSWIWSAVECTRTAMNTRALKAIRASTWMSGYLFGAGTCAGTRVLFQELRSEPHKKKEEIDGSKLIEKLASQGNSPFGSGLILNQVTVRLQCNRAKTHIVFGDMKH